MKILILEDDIELSLAMKQELLRNDYMVDCCHDGETGLLYALNAEFGYDLAIVDRMLPVIDGLTIIKAMRKKGISVPVIIITGMSSIDDRIDGLDGGADDYLVKPFYIRELLARVRALTRRPHEMKEQDILSYQDLKLERSNRKLEANGKELLLTAKESELLYTLLKSPETLLTREQLVLKVWGTDSDIEPGNVDNYISFLRKKAKAIKQHM